MTDLVRLGAKLLGIGRSVPMTHDEMISALRVTFFPYATASPRLSCFVADLRQAFRELGVQTVEFSDIQDPRSGRIPPEVAIIAAGQFVDGKLPTDFVSSLSKNTIVGIYDEPNPAAENENAQLRIDKIVNVLARDIVQVAIFVEDDKWTMCTMNGAVVLTPRDHCLRRSVLVKLIPKLAAPIDPPRLADIDIRSGLFDPNDTRYSGAVKDFGESGPLWEQTQLITYQTEMARLTFRNRRYQKIANRFLDRRTGMSYGFLVRQLPPSLTEPALRWKGAAHALGLPEKPPEACGEVLETDRGRFVCVTVNGENLLVAVPDVWLLCTRSGCSKARLDLQRDILRLGISNGRVVLETPRGLDPTTDCRPSYDTLVMLSHALGNAIAASVQARLKPAASFYDRLWHSGIALAHWHGYLQPSDLPPGMLAFGTKNVAVSCGTIQSALNAFCGKLANLESICSAEVEYCGDVQVEPHHGTNMTWSSLCGIATWLLTNRRALSPTVPVETFGDDVN